MNHKGFTLIELMITILIIIILAGSSLAAYFRFNQREEAMSDLRSFASEIRKTRAMALNLVYPDGCVGLQGYRMRTDVCSDDRTDCRKVIVEAVCQIDITVEASKKILEKASFLDPINILFEAQTGRVVAGDGTYRLRNSFDRATDVYQTSLSIDENGVLVTKMN